MIKVAALTSGRNVPSTRFRIRQFIEPLQRIGIRVQEYRPFVEKYAAPRVDALGRLWTVGKLLARIPGLLASQRSDVVWIERELLGGRFTLERFVPRKSVLDVDDAIWLMGKPGYSEKIAERCCGVIAGNSFIAEHYRNATERIWIVPTSVDTDCWKPRNRNGGPDWTVGWIGTAVNLPYLYGIEKPLAGFLAERPDAKLLVVCDREPAFKTLPARSWHFEPWSESRERDLVASMDLGLMPLPDTEWARGKCGAKMLLYMATGIPVLASPIGSSVEILAQGKLGLGANASEEWFAGLKTFYEDRDLSAAYGATGRKVVVESYSVQENTPRLAKIFAEVAGRDL